MVQYIMRQVIRGIYHPHKRKIIHHDIKPENILIELFLDDDEEEDKEEIIKKVMMMTDIKNKNFIKINQLWLMKNLKKKNEKQDERFRFLLI